MAKLITPLNVENHPLSTSSICSQYYKMYKFRNFLGKIKTKWTEVEIWIVINHVAGNN